MEHQPFETWIIDEEPRTHEQERALHQHLQECAQCRTLLEGWQAAHQHIASAGMASPAPGFSNRFQASLAERRAHQQQLSVRRTLLGLSMGAIIMFLAMIGYLLLTSSPVDWVIKIVDTALRTVTNLQTAQSFTLSWLQGVPLSIPLAVWILLSTGFFVLVVGWVFTLWRVTTQGVTNK